MKTIPENYSYNKWSKRLGLIGALSFMILFFNFVFIYNYHLYSNNYIIVVIETILVFLIILTWGIGYALACSIDLLSNNKLYKDSFYTIKEPKIKPHHIAKYTPEIKYSMDKSQNVGTFLMCIGSMMAGIILYTKDMSIFGMGLAILGMICLQSYFANLYYQIIVAHTIKHALKNNLIPEERLAEIRNKMEIDNQ
jgi:hypothetical protein